MGRGFVPTRHPPSQMSFYKLQIETYTSDWLALNQRLPWPALQVLLTFQGGSQNPGKHIYWFTVKYITKDIAECPDGRDSRARFVGMCEASCFLYAWHSPGMAPMIHKLSEPCQGFQGRFFMKAWLDRGTAKSPNYPITWLVPLATQPQPEACRSSPRVSVRTQDAQIT